MCLSRSFAIALLRAALASGATGLAELLLDRGPVEPGVLAADELVLEFEHVQEPEGDAPAVARHPQEGAGHRTSQLLIQDHRVGGEVLAGGPLLFDAEVRGQLPVELPG